MVNPKILENTYSLDVQVFGRLKNQIFNETSRKKGRDIQLFRSFKYTF